MGVRLHVCPMDGVSHPTLLDLCKACAEISAVYGLSIEWKDGHYGSLFSIYFGPEEDGGLVLGVNSEGNGDFVTFHQEGGGDLLTYLRWIRALSRCSGDQCVICDAGGGPFTVHPETNDEELQGLLDKM